MWTRNDLDINYPDRTISDYSYMAETENVEEIYDLKHVITDIQGRGTSEGH